MTLVFDTTSFSSILRGHQEIIKVSVDEAFGVRLLPLAVDAELRYGFKNGNMEQVNLEQYADLLKALGIVLFAPDQDTSQQYAVLAAWCRQHGISLSHNDLWIAATAVQHGAQLLTLDKDFSRLPQLQLAKI